MFYRNKSKSFSLIAALVAFVFSLVIAASTVVLFRIFMDVNSNSDSKKQYYQISDAKHYYYTESYEFDSSDNTINFVDIQGRKIKIYGDASIISPQD